MTLNEQTYKSFYIHHEESSLNPLIALETENFTHSHTFCNSDTICTITAQMFNNIKFSYCLTGVWKDDGPVGMQISEKALIIMDTALWITHFCCKIYDFACAYLRFT